MRPSGLVLTFGELSLMMRGAFRLAAKILVLLMVVGVIVLSGKKETWILAFLLMGLPTIVIVLGWSKGAVRGFPLLPILAIQHMVIYTTPLLAASVATQRVLDGVITKSGSCILIFLLCLYGGWAWAFDVKRHRRGSSWNLGLAEGSDAHSRMIGVAFGLLLGAITFQVGMRTGFIWNMIPNSLIGAVSILRSGAAAASMLGALIGAMMIGRGMNSGQIVFFWFLVAFSAVLLIADVLLSAASGLVGAVAMGLLFGSGRVPWKFLLVAFAILGFLNQGKFVMRNKYWSNEGFDRAKVRTIDQFPAFFAEWASASSKYLFDERQGAVGNATVEKGQSILDRVNNLQNLTYILEAYATGRYSQLDGETYLLIPALLIPRVIWPNKPRTHQGQILLNLHFGRQDSLEATQGTYVAWGLVPEAVGNYGWFVGPMSVGLVLGFLIGRLESWTVRLRLFSVEGIVTMVVMVIISLSYEMVASVLVTSLFQAIVVSSAGGMLLYLWFGRARETNESQYQAVPRGRGSKVDRYGV